MLSLTAINDEIRQCEEEIKHFMCARMSLVNHGEADSENSFPFEIEDSGIVITAANGTASAVIGTFNYTYSHSVEGKAIQWSYMYDKASFKADCIANISEHDTDDSDYFVNSFGFKYIDDDPNEGFSFDLTVNDLVFEGDGPLSLGCHLNNMTYRVVFVADDQN